MQNDTSVPPTKVRNPAESRRVRLVGRQALRRITLDMRCHDCGREPTGEAVEFRQNEAGQVGLAGLASCGRIWLCPVCNAKVMARRAIEIGLVLAWAHAHGYQIIWGALTVRHNSFSDLTQMLELQRAAWRHVVSSKRWRTSSASTTIDHEHLEECPWDCERKRDTILLNIPGRVGYIRASEITIGVNGWHPHFHPLILWRGTREKAQAFADAVVRLWVKGVEDNGGEALIEGGQQLRVLGRDAEGYTELGNYVAKSTFDAAALSMEVVWSQNKVGWASKGRAARTQSHWSLLAKIALGAGSHIEEVDRWQQLEEAILGKRVAGVEDAKRPAHRMITWSRGLRKFAGIGDEVEDEVIAAEVIGTRDDSVCFITPEGWMHLRDEPEQLALLLGTLEQSGWKGLQILLDGLGVEYFTPDEMPTDDARENDYAQRRRQEFDQTEFRDVDELRDIYVNYV